MSLKGLILASVCALLLGACSVSPSLTNELDGRQFLLDSAEGFEAVAGTRIQVGFEGKQLNAHAGCNSLGGEFEIQGERLVVDGLSQTEIGCGPALHAQDEWLAEFLTSSPHIALEGDVLTLRGDDATLHLLDREVANPDRPLQGTLWSVDTFIDSDTVSSGPSSARPTLQFGDDGKVHIDTGCNQGQGSYSVRGDRITLSEVSYQEEGCSTPMIEQHVQAVITDGDVHFEIEAQRLTLTRDEIGLSAVAQE